MNTTTKDPTWQDVLLKAASIVEEGWCQGALHRNENGDDCYPSGAVESCAEGAISRATSYVGSVNALMGLKRYLGKQSINEWNDHPDQTAGEVADAMRKAATTT